MPRSNKTPVISKTKKFEQQQLFSRSGYLTDPNMDPQFLSHLTRIAVNRKVYLPPDAAIRDRYYTKFRGRGAEGMQTEGEADCSTDLAPQP